MTDLASRVAAALEVGIGPTIIARGGAIRVTGVERDVAMLEVTGSPGSSLPLVARIEALVLAAVPELRAVRIEGPSSAAVLNGAAAAPELAEVGASAQGATAAGSDGTSLVERARGLVDAEVNPMVAAHRGHVVVDSGAPGWIRIRLGGGCQGCTLAEVTLRQGIEPLLRERLPDLIGLTDVTDHGAGTDPWFSAKKR